MDYGQKFLVSAFLEYFMRLLNKILVHNVFHIKFMERVQGSRIFPNTLLIVGCNC